MQYFRTIIYEATTGGKSMSLAQQHALRASGGMSSTLR